MPRVKQYNDESVRHDLMMMFLQKGFADTSLVDLESASGLNRRQLYNDYGDKKAVFLQALQDFSAFAGEQFLANLEQGEQGINDIQATLLGMLTLVNTPQGRLGCLVCNTARETIANDDDVKRVVHRFFRRIEKAYAQALKRAVKLEEIPGTENVRALSRFFLSIHICLCVMGRGGEPKTTLQDIVNEAMKRLK